MQQDLKNAEQTLSDVKWLKKELKASGGPRSDIIGSSETWVDTGS
jgi:hypothetical protein